MNVMKAGPSVHSLLHVQILIGLFDVGYNFHGQVQRGVVPLPEFEMDFTRDFCGDPASAIAMMMMSDTMFRGL